MAIEWRSVAIGDVAELFDGPHATPSKTSYGPIFLGISSLMNGRLDLVNTEHLSEGDYARWTRRVEPKVGDIVFSYETRLGEAAIIPSSVRCCLGRRMGLLRARPDTIDQRFLLYAYLGPQFQEVLRSRTIRGSTVDRIPLIEMPRFPIEVPPIEEQHAIAAVLGALDDKIEQNSRTARALERLARTIFQAWFVDFEPVKAKAAGEASFPSMQQDVFDALPTRFVDSAIGPVPEGWTVKGIATVATFLNGLALQKYPPRGDDADLPVIKIAELRKGSTEGADWANGDVPEQYLINDGDLLFSWSGTLEAEFWFGGKGALNQHLFKVTSSHFPSWFCFLWIRQHLPWFRAIAASKATTMGHIKRSHLQETQVAVPAADVLRAADAAIGPLYDSHAQVMIESRKLAEMRDYLLPKLLSGDVRVRDAERVAEEVG